MTVVITPKLDIHIDELIEGLYRAVAVNGEDYSYDPPEGLCRYFNSDGSPSCIMGHALSSNKEASKVLRASNNRPFYVMRSFFNITGVKEDSPIFYMIDTAQSSQDKGEPWGEVLKRFMISIDEMKA